MKPRAVDAEFWAERASATSDKPDHLPTHFRRGTSAGLDRRAAAANWPLTLTPAGVTGTAVAIFGVLLLGHGVGLVMTFGFGHDHVYGLVPLFNIGLEQNLPTVFSTLLLLVNACLFLVLSFTGEATRYMRYTWLMMATAFCFIGIDESALIHERLSAPVKALVPVEGYVFFAWVLPYAIATAVIGCVAFYAVWRLGWRYRLLFGIAGLTYVGGAVGFEIVGGNYFQSNGQQVDLTYRLFQSVEESLEITGLIILLYTLLDLLRRRSAELRLRIS